VIKQLLLDAYGCLRWRLAALFGFLLVSSLIEGLGLLILFPLLSQFGIGDSGGVGGIQHWIERGLEFLGIPNRFGPLLIVAIGITYLQVALQAGRGWFEADCQTRYTEYWQRRLFDAFIEAEWMFFTREKTASRVNVIMSEAGRIAAAFYQLLQAIAAASLMVVYAGLSLLASWQMVTLLAVFGVLIYFALRPMNSRGRALGEQVSVVSESLQHRTSEFLQNAKLIKATGTESVAQNLFAEATGRTRDVYRKAGFHSKIIFGIYMAAGYTLLGIGMWVSVEKLAISPAIVLVSIYVFLRLYVQLSNLQQTRQGVLLSIPAFPAARTQLAAAHAVAEKLDVGRQLPAGPATVRLDDIAVHYGDLAALEHVSFEVPSGACIGITGPSGAGKSTLVDVVAGLAKPGVGTVTVDGIPLDQVALRDWRRSIGYVGQETLLLNGTVAENIAWGADYDRNAVEAAATAAAAHEFVSRLPDGYDTQIGDRGVRLSGGQRQRLGLARALIGNKRLLILDEATSALDSESENVIMRALSTMRGNVTILIVAHRLSTLSDADRILVFERARLVEDGSWQELSLRNGQFSRLLHLQDMNRISA
jgi:ATP-binding cassette subfamily C protein